MPSKLLILGHRGDRQLFEDNTLEGIASAFKRGADGVEIDVFYTPHKGVYLNHKYIHDQSINYPTLEEVLKKFGPLGKLQIEIKPPDKETVKAVADLIKRYQLKNYEITSSVLPLLTYIRDLLPDALIGMIARNYLIEDWMTEEIEDYLIMGYMNLTGSNSIWLTDPSDFWSKERVDRYHAKGYKVGGHLKSDSKEDYERLISLGIDCCTADNLDVLKLKE